MPDRTNVFLFKGVVQCQSESSTKSYEVVHHTG